MSGRRGGAHTLLRLQEPDVRGLLTLDWIAANGVVSVRTARGTSFVVDDVTLWLEGRGGLLEYLADVENWGTE